MFGQEKKPAEIRYMFGIVGLWTPTQTSATVDYNVNGSTSRRYASTGVHIQNRFFFEKVSPLVVNASVGANWFSAETISMGVPIAGRYDDFVAVPISVGPEVVFPGSFPKSIFYLTGGGVDVNFIDSKNDVGNQPEWGYHLHFSIMLGAFELGLRYSSLSYIETFGLQFGMRSNLVTIKQ